ncbi:MAG: hypothetical protein GY841_16530 [FCB group bacterium]|nr:hypothetical protein [FCB group bacterium]
MKDYQEIADNCCDYLQIHDDHWPVIKVGGRTPKWANKETDLGAAMPTVDGRPTIWVNRKLCKMCGVDEVKVMLHEVAHAWAYTLHFEGDDNIREINDERFAEACEKLLYDLFCERVF